MIMHCEVDVMVLWLDPCLHKRDRIDLCFEHKVRNPCLLEFLGKTGVIGVVVGRQTALDLAERNAPPLEARAHPSHSARPTQIDEQMRSAGADYPIVGRAVPYINDRELSGFGHGCLTY